jgi:hypothetical protein
MRSDDDLELDDDDRALVDKIRALPADGDEPDWKQLEAAIRAEVAPLSPPSPWWRRWRWLVPIGALATTAAIVTTFAIRRGDRDATSATVQMTMRDASVPSETPVPVAGDEPGERAAAMWLDGEAADLGTVGPESLDALDALSVASGFDVLDVPNVAAGDPSPDAPSAASGGLDALDAFDTMNAASEGTISGDGNGRQLGVLPAIDLQWIDTLGDDEVARLETYLARKRT